VLRHSACANPSAIHHRLFPIATGIVEALHTPMTVDFVSEETPAYLTNKERIVQVYATEQRP
jgi:hypothetical protein